VKIESKIGKAAYSDQEIYAFISDFNNFRELIPSDKVSQWESTEDQCSFQVEPLGRTGLEIIEKKPYSLLKMVSLKSYSNHQFTIWIQIKPVGENDTRIKITLEPQVSKMLIPMIKAPLKKFVDGLIDKIESFDFKA
jgi:carbon monoxide dehydrogenase subunit G